MKNKLALIFLALVSFGLASCSQKELEPDTKSTITISDAKLVIPADGGQASFEVASETAFAVSTDISWVQVAVAGTKVTVSAEANVSLQSRYALVKVKNAKDETELTIMQYSLHSSGFNPEDISTSSDAAEFTFPYEYKSKPVVSCEASWVTLEVSEEALIVKVAENTDECPEGATARTTTINWALGPDSGVINVAQAYASFMKQDPNWTVSYDGVVKDSEGEDAAAITNTVANPSISGPWSTMTYPSSAIADSGLSIEDFAMQAAADMIEEYQYYIDLYAAFGLVLTWEDILNVETTTELYNPFEAGDYTAFALGVDFNGQMTGHYQYAEFTVSGGGGDKATYESWLGDWEIPHGTSGKNDTWTISEKVKGSTYTITGIEGYTDLAIEAAFESATGKLYVVAQEEIGTRVMGGVTCPVGFYGATAAGNFWTPGANPYTIFTASLNGDVATLTPATISAESGDVTLELALYIATVNGSYSLLKAFSDATKIPNTMTRGGGDDPTVDYSTWVGKWNVKNGSKTDVWTVVEKAKGSTYTIKGLAGKTYDVEAVYDPATSAMVVYAQNNLGTATSSKYGDGVVGLYGMYNDGYFASPNDWSNPYEVFSCYYADGKANLIPAEVTTDATYTIQNAYLIAEAADGSYFGVGDAAALPTTMEKDGQGGGGDDKPAYKAFLGEWEIPHGDGATTDTWTIAEKVAGSTYTITGIEGYSDLAVEAEFDAASGSIVVRAQEEVGVRTISGAECPVGFYGATAAGSFWRPGEQAYTIFTGSISGDKITIEPNAVSTQSGDVIPELALYIASVNGSYSLLKKFADATKLPNTLTRKGGQGGGDSAAEKWVGSWNVQRAGAADTWRVALNGADTYAVMGVEGDEDFVFAAKFNSATEGFSIPVQENVAQYSTSYGTASFGLYGQIEYQGEEYYITGEYDIFTAQLKGNSAAMVPGQVKLDIGEFTLKNFVILGILLDGQYKGQALSISEECTQLPNSMVKAGASSMKALAKGGLDLSKAKLVDSRKVLSVKSEQQFQPRMKALQAKSIVLKKRNTRTEKVQLRASAAVNNVLTSHKKVAAHKALTK